MEVRAVEKYIRISPRKARLVADVVRGQNAKKALVALKFMPKKAAGIIYKALNSAVANAENNFNLNGEDLVISKIVVDNGPSLKRFRPGARGMAKNLRKRTSHITVVVSADEVKSQKSKVKSPDKALDKKVKTSNSELETRTTEGSEA